MAGLFEIMAWQPGKEMMGDLQVESAVKKFRVGVTDYVGCGAELPMWEGLNWAEISSRARVVGKYDLGNTVSSQPQLSKVSAQCYLNVQWARNHVAHEEIHQACLPRTTSNKNAPVPEEEASECRYLKPPSPTTTTGFAGVVACDPEVLI